jgi:hypothetical protein
MSAAYIFASATGVGALGALYLALKPPAVPHEPPPPPRDVEADARDGLDWAPEAVPDPDAQARPLVQQLHPKPAGGSGFAPPWFRRRGAPDRDKGPGWARTGVRDLLIGLGLVVASALPFFLPVGLFARLLVAGVLLAGGLSMLQRGSARQHGLAVEKRALRKIKLPAGWAMETGVAIAGKGDADLLITSPDDLRFVVEVKAQREIVVRRGFLGGSAQILGKGGKKMPRDPLAQVVTLGGILQAFPVLWFPDGRGTPVTRIGNPEVIVVQGKERALLKAIGARRGFF